MARPKTVIVPPPWFKLVNYDQMSAMDAADWYFNLKLRLRLSLGALDAGMANHVQGQFIRGGQPVVRRGEENVVWHFFAADIGPDLTDILHGREPRLSVYPLRVEELYAFEKRFPEAIRAFGHDWVPGTSMHPNLVPEGFTGQVDHLFAQRMLNVFARVDLSLPDRILLQDFKEFIASKRKEFREVGGRQPYREALDKLGTKRRARFKTFSKLRLLPYMDLKAWAAESGQRAPASAWADLLNLDSDDDVKEARKYADLLLSPFVVDGWLIEQVRTAMRKGAS